MWSIFIYIIIVYVLVKKAQLFTNHSPLGYFVRYSLHYIMIWCIPHIIRDLIVEIFWRLNRVSLMDFSLWSITLLPWTVVIVLCLNSQVYLCYGSFSFSFGTSGFIQFILKGWVINNQTVLVSLCQWLNAFTLIQGSCNLHSRGCEQAFKNVISCSLCFYYILSASNVLCCFWFVRCYARLHPRAVNCRKKKCGHSNQVIL